MMEKIAQKLSDEDINNAAAYLSQASDSTAGDGLEIENATVLTNVKIVK
jgi:cytochrome c553